MKNEKSLIWENVKLTEGIYRMTLEMPENHFTAPGQFAMVEVPELFLRRPISVSSYDSERYALIYKIVGAGTQKMSEMQIGEQVHVLTGLGNGYDVESIPDGAFLIGGGIGIPPMLGLLKSLVMAGKRCRVILGFNTKEDVFLVDDFRCFADDVTVMTADGSYGAKGFVTDAFDHCEYACACGPLRMLRALDEKVADGQFSLEARMGCGSGACMGCSIETRSGARRICKEGPVFHKRELIWENL